MDQRDLKAAGEFAQNFGCFNLKIILPISGIYGIRNKITGQIYVGSAIHMGNRLYVHRKRLRIGKHPNKYLQLSWNKYWEQSFEFIILEYVESLSLLLHAEECWIEYFTCYKKELGYNARRKPNSNLGLKFSEETKRKQSLAGKGHSRNKGSVISERTKQILSDSNRGIPNTRLRNYERWPCADG